MWKRGKLGLAGICVSRRESSKEGRGRVVAITGGVRTDRGMCGKGGNKRGRVGLCVQGDRGLWDRGDGRAGVCERLHR